MTVRTRRFLAAAVAVCALVVLAWAAWPVRTTAAVRGDAAAVAVKNATQDCLFHQVTGLVPRGTEVWLDEDDVATWLTVQTAIAPWISAAPTRRSAAVVVTVRSGGEPGSCGHLRLVATGAAP